MSNKPKEKSVWNLFTASDDLDPVQCYRSTPAKYLEKFGFIKNGKYDCNGDADISTKKRFNQQQTKLLKFDHSLFIDYEKCSKLTKCQDLIKSNTFNNHQHLMKMLKENNCLSCLNSSLL